MALSVSEVRVPPRTVRVRVPAMEPLVAVRTAAPVLVPVVTRPSSPAALLTVALDQVTASVMSASLPSLYTPMARTQVW